MKYVAFILIYVLILFVGMVAFAEIGRRLSHNKARRHGAEEAWEGVSTVDGAILGLMGLVLAFTFSGALSRLDARRHLIVQETNAIGTAYLRIDLLSPEYQPTLREDFRRYLDSRIKTYAVLPDVDAARKELVTGKKLQDEIWAHALTSVQASPAPATQLVMPTLNQMFDIVTTRTMATLFHPPPVVFAMLMALAFIGSAVGGYNMGKAKTRPWLRTIGFAVVTSITVYVILNLEYPRIGLFGVDDFDQALLELRATMN